MVKEAPSAGRMIAMIAFALSCVGILLYLWLVFGGSIPLRPEGYRFQVKFPEATQLAQEADVRISGVNVGKVKLKEPDQESGLTETQIEIDERYAPLPQDTKAVLRQKSLLGETYVELSPGRREGEMMRDGGRLPAGAVSPTVEIDEIFRTFGPKTRRAFRTWLSEQGRAVDAGGQNLNNALATLTPFAQDVGDVLKILDEQEQATRGLVRDTGAVFNALSARRGQLRSLVSTSNRVFETTANRDRQLADAFVAFPTFLREGRTTTRRLSRFAADTNPLITQLRPAARELSPTLVSLANVAPDLEGAIRDLAPLERTSRRGLPAFEQILDDVRPVLETAGAYFRAFQPITDYLGQYKREITAFLANSTAAVQAGDSSGKYLRTTNPVSPESLAAYSRRLPTNRSNPYAEPGANDQIARGLPVFGTYLCQSGGSPQVPAPSALLPAQLQGLIQQFVFTATGPTAPPCREQAPLGRLVGQPGKYPQIGTLPSPDE